MFEQIASSILNAIRAALSLATALAIVTTSQSRLSAQGGLERIVLVNADPALVHAARVALGADYQLSTREEEEPPKLGAASAQVIEAFRNAAQQTGAAVVVWTRPGPRMQELSVYDAAADRLLGARPLPRRPLDDVTAAAVILSLKTLLRQPEDRQLPEPEAVVPSHAPVTAPESTAPFAPTPQTQQPVPSAAVVSQPAKTLQRAEAGEAPGVVVPAEPAPLDTSAQARSQRSEPAAAGASRLDLSLAAGAARLERRVEARLGLSTAWWPSSKQLGVRVSAEAGPPLAAQGRGEGARLFDAALALGVHLRSKPTRAWQVAGGLGPRVELTRVSGEVRPRTAIDVLRVTPGLDLLVGARVCWSSRWFVGVSAYLSVALRTQRYWVDDMLVFDLARFRVGAAIELGYSVW